MSDLTLNVLADATLYMCALMWDGINATSEMQQTEKGTSYILVVRCSDGKDYYFPHVEQVLADGFAEWVKEQKRSPPHYRAIRRIENESSNDCRNRETGTR